ncbi:MAG TPA: hypothetical protein DF383_13530 [Deltaproteobacteria bacterium]|nr:hypothetical protein [Deltaproteobacteria bacterium]
MFLLSLTLLPQAAEAQSAPSPKPFGKIEISAFQKEYPLSLESLPIIPLKLSFSRMTENGEAMEAYVQEKILIEAAGKYKKTACQKYFTLEQPLVFRGKKEMTFTQAGDFLATCAARGIKGDTLTIKIKVIFGKVQAHPAVSNPIEISIRFPDG